MLFCLNACGDTHYFDQPNLKNRVQSPPDRLFFAIPYRLTSPYRLSSPYCLFGQVRILQRCALLKLDTLAYRFCAKISSIINSGEPSACMRATQ